MPWIAKRDFYNPNGGKIKKGDTVPDAIVAILPGRPGSYVDLEADTKPEAPPAPKT